MAPSVVSAPTVPSSASGTAQDDRERQDPALILAGENEIDQQEREAEDVIGLRADLLLLVGHGGPFEARSGRQTCAAICSMMSRACPELKPGAGLPTMVAEG